MDEFAHVRIGRLFDGVQAHIGYVSGAPIEGEKFFAQPFNTIQYHVECGMSFLGHWLYKQNMGSPIFTGRDYYCPRCGQHVRYPEDTIYETSIDDKDIPCDMDLRAVAYKHYLDILVQAHTVRVAYIERTINLHPRIRKWRLRFDFKTRRTTYKMIGGEEPEVVMWPFGALNQNKELTKVRDTIFSYLLPDGRLVGATRREIDQFMTTVAHRFRAMQEAHVWHRVPSPFVQTSGQCWGASILSKPISNLIWRLAAPDARNLRESEYRMVATDVDTARLQHFLALLQSGSSFLEAGRTVFRLPPKKAVDRLAVSAGLLDLPVLSLLFRSIRNYDFALKAAEEFEASKDIRLRSVIRDYMWLVRLIDRKRGSEDAYKVAHLLVKQSYQVSDGVHVYKQLTPANKRLFLQSRWKIKTAHDALVALHNKQRFANQQIIYRKPDMRLPAIYAEAGLSFCLPPDTDNLRALGKVMHNCAGTYCDKVLDNWTTVIGVFAEGNHPVVCIEVQKGTIIQAKLACNHPVCGDHALNAAVILWADDKGLLIDTTDIVRPERRREGA